MLDRSQSAPAAVRQASASGPCRDPPGDQELPQPSASAKNVVTAPRPARPPSPPPAPAVSPSEVLGASFPAEDTTRARDPGGAGPEESMSTALLPQPEECSPTQAMEQEEEVEPQVAEDAGADLLPAQPDPVEMEFPVDSQDAGSSEGEQPERERPSCSGSIPSLAAALMELHELLESNSQAHAASRSSPQPVQQETDPAGPDSHTPALDVIHIPGPAAAAATATPGAESSDAKAKTFAAVSDEGPSNCVAPGPPQPEGGGAARNVGEQRPPQCPEGSVEEKTTRERHEVEETCVLQADPDAPPVPVGEPESREPVAGCQESPGLRDQHASLGPPAAAGEVSDASIGSPPPPPLPEAPQRSPADPAASARHPFTDHFPAEHIQRIQAAGFSASEAAEALQRAHGVVELALLALLARSITVPT